MSLHWNISSSLAWRLYFKHFIHIRRIWTANIFLKNIDNRLKDFWILWVSSFISLALAGEHSWFSSEEEIKRDDDVFGNRLEPNKWLFCSMRARLKCSILTQGSTQPRNTPPLQNVYVWIFQLTCLNFKMYLSEFTNLSVWISKYICPECAILAKGCTRPRLSNIAPRCMWNVFVWVSKCICRIFKMYFSKFQNVFVSRARELLEEQKKKKDRDRRTMRLG